MLKIAICDDSKSDVEKLECALDKLKRYPIEYDVYYNADELLKYQKAYDEKYHVYILDIEMSKTNGLELAKIIRQCDPKALFIFLTSYPGYVMQVFEVITFDYICKPITAEKLEEVVTKILRYLNLIKRDFVFHYRKNQFRVSCDEIKYIKKNGRQAIIYTEETEYKANMTIAQVWEQLNESVFVTIHSSIIVNLAYVKEIAGDYITMKTDESFFITRIHKQNLKAKHLNFVKEML